ncbi:hypothetical protein [Sphingomonas sp.]|uniref:hypothetical protein n=1 Tax=Sphingomonas sp. TaxID=28214 RepID=UPI003B00E1F7
MSFRLEPTVAAALRTGRHPLAPLVEVVLPGYTMRQLVGSGEVIDWRDPTHRFVARDAQFGVLTSAGTLKDGVGDEAPEWDLTFAPPDEASAATLTSAMAQGGEVNGWLGVIDRASGALIPEPVQVFAGELDVARLRIGKGSRTVEWRCVSALEVFHDQEVGSRLSDAWHKLIWPGEDGLANMTGIEKTSFWGVEKPPSAVSTTNGSVVATFAGLLGR